MRVLIADKLPDSARTELQAHGLEVVTKSGAADAALAAALTEVDPDVLVVRSTKVKAAHFAAAPSLQLVVRAGAGVNTIDLDAASSRAVFVTNCPGMNAVAVAELTIGHLLNADRRIADNVATLRDGQWAKGEFSKASGLKGRTLGVLGCGAIGREVIRRAQAFEMHVVAWSPRLDEARAKALGVRRCDSAIDVARACDALTVHVELTPTTRGLIGEAIFDALRPGAVFINTSRGEVVDEEALARAITEKKLRAGLDVFDGEPTADGEWKPSLASLPGVYGTHHIGASTAEAQEAVAAEAVRIILEFAATGSAPNVVNLAEHTPATHLLVVRHQDKVGVLAGLLEALRDGGINVQRMQNIIFSGDEGAACARIQIEGALDAALLDRVRADAAIYDVKVVTLTE
ncbi:MAG: hydroxyacid dehydrogenase [Myxococcales bacterium]|nr:hydroxyacid dehydrogenase [Myxococcales bacterium]